MNKQDVPRLRAFLGILMRVDYSKLPGRDMVKLVNDMNWLAKYADDLDGPDMKVKSEDPIKSVETKKKK